jgi:3-hydroxyisobutyrate dehydrogenase-like beta-hydroxyacid dehydrogenase
LNELLTKALSANCSLKGKIFVDTSTVHPETCASAAERLRDEGAYFVASPVFGDRNVAAAGKLIFSMAGPGAVIETLRPFVMDIMGRSIINMGEDVRKSSLLKISG